MNSTLKFYRVTVTGGFRYRAIEDVRLTWDNLPPAVLMKWKWYFQYRLHLLYVQHPRGYFHLSVSVIEPDSRTADTFKANMIRRRRGQITAIETKLQKARDSWTQLFPIEDEELYIRACAKHARLIRELNEFLAQ